jgi:hypothetical protein
MELPMTEVAKGYLGWALPREIRDTLLEKFPPAYPTVVAHHCTAQFGVDSSTPLPTESSGTVVGVADDNNGVQALVLSIGGSTTRPDGRTYHITWSLNPGRKPVESNDVIKRLGWAPASPFVKIPLTPRFFSFLGRKPVDKP